VELLQNEDVKTRKKIDETKKKAKQIIDKKKENERIADQKFQNAAKSSASLQDNQKELLEISKQRQMEIKAIQSQIAKTKHDEAKERKKERELNDLKKKQFEQDFIQANQEKKLVIKEIERKGLDKLSQYSEKRKEFGKQHYKERVQRHQQDIQDKQTELAKYEAIESELIKKLQHTQTVQKQAFDELESALKYSTGSK
jgi:hypothetical protein